VKTIIAATTLTSMAILLTASPPADAVWGWMSGTAMEQFTDGDWDILRSEVRDLIDEGADGDRVDWENPDTGNGGAVRVLNDFEHNGMRCRETAFRNYTKNEVLVGQFTGHLCEQEDGAWKFVADSDPQLPGIQEQADAFPAPEVQTPADK
jgi:surface antigen